MKTQIDSIRLLFGFFFLFNTMLLTSCTKEEAEKLASDIAKEFEMLEENSDQSSNDSSNDSTNDNDNVQTVEKEILTTTFDEKGEVSSTSITHLVFEEERIVKEIFPDGAAGEEGKFVTKEYKYNEKQLITQIRITDEFPSTEDLTYTIQYNEEDVITHIKESSNAEGIDLSYQQTNSDGGWEYTNPKGEKALIAFDEFLNWTEFTALGASTTEISLFVTQTYDTDIMGFYPKSPKYHSFISWLTTTFNFLPSDGHFMTTYALQTQTTFWGSEQAYQNQNFDLGDYKASRTTNEYDSAGNLVKIILVDSVSGQIHATLELKK
jgi:hypothetical protein